MQEQPNTLMIVVDCLRSDRLFSSERTCKTPNIDSLIARGTSVPNVFVENSMTAPSFASLFTGRYAGNNGVTGMVGVKLSENNSTMAEIFTAQGYETYAEVTGPLNPILGIDKGFAHYNFRSQHDYFFTDWGKTLLERLRRGDFKSPYFLLVHLWEIHVPRQVRPGFDSPEFGDTAYDRSLSSLDPFIGELTAAVGPETAVILTGDHGECVGELPEEDTLLPYFLNKLNLPPMSFEEAGSIDSVVDLMAEKPLLHSFTKEISQIADKGEGKMGLKQRLIMMFNLILIGITRYRIQLKKGVRSGFFSNLRQKLSDLFIFLAVARGKPEAVQLQLVKTSLSEHSLQHGYHIYDYLQQVPAVFVKNGLFPKGHQVDTEVRQIDLLPTLTDAFNFSPKINDFDGSSYFPFMINGGGKNRSIFLEARGGAQAEKVFLIRGVRRNGQKIAYAPFEENAPTEFYDITKDRTESNNISQIETEKVLELSQEAEALKRSFSTEGSALSSKENMEMAKRLKDLGYI